MLKYKNEIGKYSGQWRAYCYDSHAAEILNKRFRTYGDTDMVATKSEGVFDFPEKDLPFVRAVLLKFGGIE